MKKHKPHNQTPTDMAEFLRRSGHLDVYIPKHITIDKDAYGDTDNDPKRQLLPDKHSMRPYRAPYDAAARTIALPKHLDTDDFRKAWIGFLDVQRSKKNLTQAELIILDLGKIPEEWAAIVCLQYSIKAAYPAVYTDDWIHGDDYFSWSAKKQEAYEVYEDTKYSGWMESLSERDSLVHQWTTGQVNKDNRPNAIDIHMAECKLTPAEFDAYLTTIADKQRARV